jgi:hypothetical protein
MATKTVTISMQSIYEEVFVDVRDALCGCANCARSQPVQPTFDSALAYVAREEHVARLRARCARLVPAHFIATRLTTTLLRARGMDIEDVHHMVDVHVDLVTKQIRAKSPGAREVIFDTRVLEVLRKMFAYELPELSTVPTSMLFSPVPITLSCATPIDYFHDVRPKLIMYADVLLAAHEAVANVTPAPGHKLGTVTATIHVHDDGVVLTEPAAAAAAAAGGGESAVDELAELIRQIELEEQSKRPSKGNRKKQNAKKNARAETPPPTTAPVVSDVTEKVCSVCMDAHVAVAINACGHVALCEDCYDRTDIKRCPVCQQGECMGTVVWPQADERPPGCRKCTRAFPNLRCACGTMTCEPCGPCQCRKGKARKLFWVG